MLKSLTPLFYTAAGVVVAGATGYFVVENDKVMDAAQKFFEPAAVETVVTEKPDAKKPLQETTIAKLPETVETKDAPKPEPLAPEKDDEIVAETAPSFDILRVEKDGSVVIAGKAPANSEVEIVDASRDNAIIGTTKALASGDYVVVLEQPLLPGKHELYIVAREKGKPAIQSADAGLIDIPEANSENGPMVVVSNPLKPTRVLQNPQTVKPEIKTETAEVAAEQKPVETAKLETSETPKESVAEKVVETPDASDESKLAAVEEPKTAEQSEPEPAPQSAPAPTVRPVLIEAADVEQDKVFIAGVGEPGKTINMYLGDEFIGSSKVSESGAFLFEGKLSLKPGRYPVRADMVDSQGSNVLARAEVNLVHQPKVDLAAVAEEKKEPEPVKKSEPEPKQKQEETVISKVESEPVTAESPDAKPEKTAELPKPDTEQVAEIRTGASVIIRRGDSLWRVASRSYGEGIRFTTIFEANRDQVRNPHLIYPGQVLKIPEAVKSEPVSDSG